MYPDRTWPLSPREMHDATRLYGLGRMKPLSGRRLALRQLRGRKRLAGLAQDLVANGSPVDTPVDSTVTADTPVDSTPIIDTSPAPVDYSWLTSAGGVLQTLATSAQGLLPYFLPKPPPGMIYGPGGKLQPLGLQTGVRPATSGLSPVVLIGGAVLVGGLAWVMLRKRR
jgi:hypothetical protein